MWMKEAFWMSAQAKKKFLNEKWQQQQKKQG